MDAGQHRGWIDPLMQPAPVASQPTLHLFCRGNSQWQHEYECRKTYGTTGTLQKLLAQGRRQPANVELEKNQKMNTTIKKVKSPSIGPNFKTTYQPVHLRSGDASSVKRSAQSPVVCINTSAGSGPNLSVTAPYSVQLKGSRHSTNTVTLIKRSAI
jgi:hypothetical protein